AGWGGEISAQGAVEPGKLRFDGAFGVVVLHEVLVQEDVEKEGHDQAADARDEPGDEGNHDPHHWIAEVGRHGPEYAHVQADALEAWTELVGPPRGRGSVPGQGSGRVEELEAPPVVVT